MVVHGFFDNYDVIIAITMVCATMATLLVGGELDAESCGGVELVAKREEMVKTGCSLFVHGMDNNPAFTKCQESYQEQESIFETQERSRSGKNLTLHTL